MVRLFLSYAWTDQRLALRLAEAVKSLGVEVGLDGWRLRAGGRSFQGVEQDLRAEDLAAVLLTDISVTSGWVEEVLTLTGELGVAPEALERLLVALPTPESFLSELRHHLGDRTEYLKRLFYGDLDGVGDLWRAGQLAKLIAEDR